MTAPLQDVLLQMVGPVMGVVATAIASWIAWSVRSRFVSRSEHDAQVTHTAEIFRRVEALERSLAQLPTALRQAVAETIVPLERRVGDIAQAQTRLESELRILPNVQALHDVELTLRSIGGTIATMEARVEAMKEVSERLDRQVGVIDDFVRRMPSPRNSR